MTLINLAQFYLRKADGTRENCFRANIVFDGFKLARQKISVSDILLAGDAQTFLVKMPQSGKYAVIVTECSSSHSVLLLSLGSI